MDGASDQAKRIWFTVGVVLPFAAFETVHIFHSHHEPITPDIAAALITCLVAGFVVWRVVRQQPKAPSFTHPFLIAIVAIFCILIALDLAH
jgi:hypothetical protein